MNGLEIVVIGILILNVFWGYKRGFLRVAYSLISWILLLGFVTWSTPYITEYLEKNTEIKAYLQQKCLAYIERSANEIIIEGTLDATENMGQTTEADNAGLSDNILEQIAQMTANSAGEVFEDMGLYEQMAESVAHFIIEGIAFFAALIIAGIISACLGNILDLVSYLPIIHGANKTLGALAGVLKGIILIWLGFYIVTIFAATDGGKQLLIYIEESPFLLYLYNHNIVLEIIMTFL